MQKIIDFVRWFFIKRELLKCRLYVSCSLTQSTAEFKSQIESLKSSFKNKGFEVFEFLGTEKGTSADVYKWDIHHCVKRCDVIVAICDVPAIGLGYELGVAIEKWGKLVLAFAGEETRVTRLVQGVDHKNFTFLRYKELGEVVSMVIDKIYKN